MKNPEQQLSPQQLLELLPNLGMVIDLTNTERYYDPIKSFQVKNIEYVKIKIPGHYIPDECYRTRFNESVKIFLTKNKDNDKLIGVHCTHGVNRTGFLICNYMVNIQNIKPQDALKRFEVGRGHKIDRETYTNFILNNFKSAQSNEWNNSSVSYSNEYNHRSTSFPITNWRERSYNHTERPINWWRNTSNTNRNDREYNRNSSYLSQRFSKRFDSRTRQQHTSKQNEFQESKK